MTTTFRRRLAPVLTALLAATALMAGGPSSVAASGGYLPAIGHVFVINMENKGYDETWGPGSAAPYLSQTLRGQGVLLSQYYGIGHNSLGNYLAQISGQGPNAKTQADCPAYDEFVQTGTAAQGQAVGHGCVYPASVPTLAGQLTGAGRTWKGYMEDMGTPCRHPALGSVDDTQKAKVGDQYAARDNPFVYFHGIIDSTACARDVVDLNALSTDLNPRPPRPI